MKRWNNLSQVTAPAPGLTPGFTFAGTCGFKPGIGTALRAGVLACVMLMVVCTAAYGQGDGETFGRVGYEQPENVFEASRGVDQLYDIILYITVVVFFAVFGLLIFFAVHYRYRPGRRAKFIHGNDKLETFWTLVPTVIMALIAAFSQSTWSSLKDPTVIQNLENAIDVQVVAKQFAWYFHYPGADGKFGNRTFELINLQASEPDKIIGLDRTSDGGKDDLVTTQMYIPVNRNVRIRLTSVDVLHSFFLPNFRVKQDTVPGLTGYVWINASKTSAQVRGTFAGGDPKPFDIVCAELCGQGHYKMRGQLFVVSNERYEQFLKEEASFLPDDEDDEGY